MRALMRRAALLALAAAALAAPAAQAEYSIEDFDITFTGPKGETLTQAGAHPFAMTTSFNVHGEASPEGGFLLDEPIKDLLATQVAGFAGAPSAVPACSTTDFLTASNVRGNNAPGCPDSAAVGTVAVRLSNAQSVGVTFYAPVYSLEPAHGEAAKFGFYIADIPVTIGAGVRQAPPYQVIAGSTNTSQLVEAVGADFTLWGVPADPRHDPLRGPCLDVTNGKSAGNCPLNIAEVPFLTLPRACLGPLSSRYESDSWEHPGAWLPNGFPDLSDPSWVTGEVLSHDELGNPQGMSGCDGSASTPKSAPSRPPRRRAARPAWTSPSTSQTRAWSTPPKKRSRTPTSKKPSSPCPRASPPTPRWPKASRSAPKPTWRAETAFSAPGAGCPQRLQDRHGRSGNPAARRKALKGALYIAKPYENQFGTLLALYLVIKSPELGIFVIQAAEGHPRPGNRPARHHRRRNPPAALLPLPPALPRGRQEPADQPAPLRRL